ncbi:MAG: homogentisate phytyltransferase [Synechococcales cyanobacterium T60_A2020_003]|nr:homogentisate phytyltransferase [Synechococcales cyanobacterium T60_A2020_003]
MSLVSEDKTPSSKRERSSVHLLQRRFPFIYALWKFSRPHTIIGTTLSVLGLYLIALAERSPLAVAEPNGWLILASIGLTWLTCICGNVYIVGLNQIEDVEIDRINKPHLPLASGEFSRPQAIAIVGITGILAIALSVLQGYGLMATVGLSVLIGTAYSLPPIRLKRFPLWASVCIFTVRGVVVNLGLFLHARQVVGDRHLWLWNQGAFNLDLPSPVWLLTAFILGYTFAIAIFKDIPDLEGDRQYNIQTFTVTLGAATVLNWARWVITACYVGVMLGAMVIPSIHTGFVITTHVAVLILFWMRSGRVSLHQKQAIAQFYQFIWKLFFLEYILFPIACWLA